jgi:hypothetical protein
MVSFAMGVFVVSDVFAENAEFKIPDWVKKVAGLWHDDRIGDNTFLQTIKWLIENEIIILPTTDTEDKSSNEVPAWVKNNAGWWANDQIDDKTFLNGIQYLIEVGLIQIDMSERGGVGGGGY